jgi:hypothetical protein
MLETDNKIIDNKITQKYYHHSYHGYHQLHVITTTQHISIGEDTICLKKTRVCNWFHKKNYIICACEKTEQENLDLYYVTSSTLG